MEVIQNGEGRELNGSLLGGNVNKVKVNTGFLPDPSKVVGLGVGAVREK
jgi:hypothetical protein